MWNMNLIPLISLGLAGGFLLLGLITLSIAAVVEQFYKYGANEKIVSIIFSIIIGVIVCCGTVFAISAYPIMSKDSNAHDEYDEYEQVYLDLSYQDFEVGNEILEKKVNELNDWYDYVVKEVELKGNGSVYCFIDFDEFKRIVIKE